MQKTDIFILRAASKIAKTQRENEPLAPTNRASRLAVIAELGGPTLKPATKSGIATDRLLVEAVEAAKTARRARRNRRSYPLDPKAARIKEFGTAAPLFPSGVQPDAMPRRSENYISAPLEISTSAFLALKATPLH